MAIDPILSAFGNMYQFAQSPDPVGNLNQSLSQGYQITTGQQAAPELERLAQMAQSGALPPIPTGISYIDSANLGASPAESAEIAASTAFNNLNAQERAEIEEELQSRQGRVKSAFVHLSSTFPGMAVYGLTPTRQFEITIDEFAKQYDITPAELKDEMAAIQKQGGYRSPPHPSEGEAQFVSGYHITHKDYKEKDKDDEPTEIIENLFNPPDDDGATEDDDGTPTVWEYGVMGNQEGETASVVPGASDSKEGKDSVGEEVLTHWSKQARGEVSDYIGWGEDTVPIALFSPRNQWRTVAANFYGARFNDPVLKQRIDDYFMPSLGQFLLQVAVNPDWNPAQNLNERGVSDDPAHEVYFQWAERGLKESPEEFFDSHLQDVSYNTFLEADQKRHDTWDRTPAERRALYIVQDNGYAEAILRAKYSPRLGGVSGGLAEAEYQKAWTDYHRYASFTPNAMGPLAWFAENIGGPFAGTETQPRDISSEGSGRTQTGRSDRTAVGNWDIGRSDQPVAPFPTTLTNPIDDPYPFSTVNR